jgi:hypothetical protein
MAKFIDIEMVDGTLHEQIRILPIDIVRAERHFSVSLGRLVTDGTVLTEHGMFLAHSALHRSGKFSGSFDDFMEQVAESNEASEETAEILPFSQGASGSG